MRSSASASCLRVSWTSWLLTAPMSCAGERRTGRPARWLVRPRSQAPFWISALPLHGNTLGMQFGVPPGRLVSAMEPGPATPPSAPGNPGVGLDDEACAIAYELCVESHDSSARFDLTGVEERLLKLRNGCAHQRPQLVRIRECREPVCEVDASHSIGVLLRARPQCSADAAGGPLD